MKAERLSDIVPFKKHGGDAWQCIGLGLFFPSQQIVRKFVLSGFQSCGRPERLREYAGLEAFGFHRCLFVRVGRLEPRGYTRRK